MKYHVYIYDRFSSFPVCIKVFKNLQFNVRTDFWLKILLLENTQLSLSRGKNWIFVGNSYARTLQVRKAFDIRRVNSSNLSFHAYLRNTVKHVPCIFQFEFNSGTLENVQLPSSKSHINSYACRLTGPTFGATSKKFQFHI